MHMFQVNTKVRSCTNLTMAKSSINWNLFHNKRLKNKAKGITNSLKFQHMDTTKSKWIK